MITVMVSGILSKPPEQRTSKNGNAFTLASIRTQTAEGDLYASVTAFGDLCPALAGLAKGDPLTVIGTARVSTYTGKDGATKAGLSIIASRIIALADHQAAPGPKGRGNEGRRRDWPPAPAEPPGPLPELPPVEAYDDPIPF